MIPFSPQASRNQSNPHSKTTALTYFGIWIARLSSRFNSFAPNATFVYPLKTSEKFTVFWYFQRVEKGCIWNEWFKFEMVFFEEGCNQFCHWTNTDWPKKFTPSGNSLSIIFNEQKSKFSIKDFFSYWD